MSVNNVIFGVGFVAGGLLNDRYGARWVWGGVGVVLGIAALLAFVLARGMRTAPEPEPEPAV